MVHVLLVAHYSVFVVAPAARMVGGLHQIFVDISPPGKLSKFYVKVSSSSSDIGFQGS